MQRKPKRTADAAVVATVIAPCPICKQPVNVGRHKSTGSMIINCPGCKTFFPDAAGTKRLLDVNVLNGWNVYATLQSKLTEGSPLDQADFAAAFEKIRAAVKG